jgi:streptogramin lyase
MWFTNMNNNSIGRVTTAGVLSNFTGTGISQPRGIAEGPDGAMWFANFGNGSIGRITTAGVVSNFADPQIAAPWGIAAGPDGAMWFTNNTSSSIGRITMAGTVSKYTGLGGSYPRGITVGPDGALWFTAISPPQMGRITTSGFVTMSGLWQVPFASDVINGPDGALWLPSSGGATRVTTGWAVTQFGVTGGSSRQLQYGTVGPDGALWFTDGGTTFGDVVRMQTDGTFTLFAAGSSQARDIVAGPDGAVWFANSASVVRVQSAVGPPGAPTGVAATATNRSATVTWQAPAAVGGGAISGYTVTASPGGATCAWTSGPLNCVVMGLTNGTAYTFSATATNVNGAGPPSSQSSPATPVAVAVTSVSPSAGVPAGGATVTVHGWGFNAASAVRFGSTTASYSIVDDTTITATSPARPVGLVNVFVETPAATSAPGQQAWFNYVTGPTAGPQITATSPNSGTNAGGTVITLTGTGFLSTSAVRFGPSTPAAGFSVISDTELQVTTPAYPNGLVNIWVTNNVGTSSSAQSSWYYFRTVTGPPPAVTAVSPSHGSTAGGTAVTITGTGFTNATQVRFGPTNAPGYTVVNDTTITVTSPPRPAGLATVYVTTGNGTSSATSNAYFNYA